MIDNELNNILTLVDKYIENKQLNKSWIPGEDWVYYAGPYFNSEEYVRGIRSFLKGWLVLGAEGALFEKKFAKFLGKNHGLLTNSGSSANLLMMSAVASKNLNNFTTINPIFQVGFEPVFVDIELPSLNLNIEHAEEVLRKHDIKIITFAHVLGNPPNMDQIMELVKKYNLILLEDCCDALAGTYDEKLLRFLDATADIISKFALEPLLVSNP